MAFDPLKATAVCDLLAEFEVAKSLRQACAIVGVAPSTFLYWCSQHEDVAKQYARANEIATDLSFEEFQELNDQPPQTNRFGVDPAWVQWQRMRLDNKKWEMCKRRPSKYSDRITHAGDSANPVAVTVETGELIERIIGNRYAVQPSVGDGAADQASSADAE